MKLRIFGVDNGGVMVYKNKYKGKVLRIDDVPDSVEIFKTFVCDTGATYLRAYSGKAGIKLAKTEQQNNLT
jgi:hypothetical protein